MNETKESIKKIIEQKQQKSSSQSNKKRPTKTIGEWRKAIRPKRGGGLFDGK